MLASRLPLTASQTRIWLGEELHKGAPIYNVGFAFSISGELDHVRFGKAFEQLVAETDALRVRFGEEDGRPFQWFDPEAQIPLPHIEAAELSATEVTETIASLTRESFQIEIGCLRSYLFKLGPRKQIWLVVQHHLATDALSGPILLERLSSIYDSLGGGERAGEAWPQFAEFVRSNGRAQDPTESHDDRPTNRAWSKFYTGRPPSDRAAGCRRIIPLGASRARRLKERIESDAFESFSHHLARFQWIASTALTFLSRLENTASPSLGMATTSRSSPDLRNVVGPLIQLRALDVTLTEGENFRGIYEQVRSTMGAVLGGPESGDQTVSGDVIINYIPEFSGRFAGRETEIEWIYPGAHDPDHRLRIHFQDYGESREPDIIFDFNVDAFDAEDRERVITHFFRVFDEALGDPERAIHDYELLAAGEEQALLELGGGGEVVAPPEISLADVFENVAHSFPDRVAVEWDGGSLTYAELLERTRRLASQLVGAGISAGDVVPVFAGREAAHAEGALAVMGADCTYLPVDPDLPRGRLLELLDDVGARVGICGAKSFVPDRDHLHLLETGRTGGSGNEEQSPRTTPVADHPAYVLYTSGSTGRPNGVAVEHRGVIQLLEEMDRRAPLGEARRVAWWTNVGFDVSVYEIYSALLRGHTLVIPPEEIRLEPNLMFGWLQEQGIHSAYLPPFFLSRLPQWLDEHGPLLLERLLVGVEPIPERTLGSLRERLPSLEIVNGYGPTEATVCATFHVIGQTPEGDGITPIGTPLTGNRCYVIDRHGNLMPRGAVGELAIAGLGLARGYWNRPNLNEERFVENPFNPGGAQRMYRTGDLVRWRRDGALEFHGRIDHQLKIRGQRIEPEEVASVMSQLPEVSQCLVASRMVGTQSELCCYLTGTEEVDDSRLRSHAAHHLPFQLIPRFFVQVDRFPVTRNGKIDLENLPAPALDRAPAPAPAGGSTTREAPLLDIWKRVLSHEKIASSDNFFDLGGDSVKALQIVARARAAGIYLKPGQLFSHQTVAELAAIAGDVNRPAQEREPFVGRFPLSPIQRWFFEQDLEQKHFWCQALEFDLPTGISSSDLAQGLRHLVNRHEILRACFRCGPDGWTAEVVPPLDDTQEIEISHETSDDIATSLAATIDLAQAPLLRAAWVERDGGSPTAVLAIHHLVVDAISWPILLDDLGQLLASDDGEAPGLAAATVPFPEWSIALEESAAGESPGGPGRWCSPGAESGAIPREEVSNEVCEASAESLVTSLSESETRALLALTSRGGTSPVLEILVTAVAETLRQWTNRDLVSLELEGHGRDAGSAGLDVSRTVGWFTARHPLHLDLAGKSDPLIAHQSVREKLGELHGCGAQYGLLRYLHPDPETRAALASEAPPEVLFNYLGREEDLVPRESGFRQRGGLALVRGPENRRTDLLEIHAVTSQGRLEMHWTFSRDLHRLDTIREQAEKCLRVVTDLTEKLAAGHTGAMDFPLADLDEQRLKKLKGVLEKLE
ncbi:MAG: amino acid adenylation domain-containing protein [Verrucomicrobiales bacterium]